VQQEYESKVFPMCEGDDAIGILHTSMDDTIICSIDKDMLTLGGLYYDYGKDEFHDTSPEDAFYRHMLQTLTGDPTDFYPGAKGIGAKTAQKILDKDCSWEAVVRAYESKGLTEEDALTMARVAKILTRHEYNLSTHEVLLWNPKTPDLA
jgi:DNA polymerase-1